MKFYFLGIEIPMMMKEEIEDQIEIEILPDIEMMTEEGIGEEVETGMMREETEEEMKMIEEVGGMIAEVDDEVPVLGGETMI